MIYRYDKENLTYNKIDNKIITTILVALIGVFFVVIDNLKEIKFTTSETRAIILKEQNEFTKDKLKAYLLELNIKYPHIVYAQSQIETGNFTSKIFKENSNCFGMKCATKRPTTNKGEENGHAYYNTWRESVVDYAFYSATFLSDIKTEKQYLEYLRQNYAEDTLYVNKILKIISK